MNHDEILETRTAELAGLLEARQLRVSTAESCTGGWLAKCLTDQPGSSAWFEFGFVTYGNNAKLALLGVREETLAANGAVSQAVAEEMAKGARLSSGADLAVAVTGIAGPTGGSADKPVGTVWLAWAGPDGLLGAELRLFPGNRAAIRSQAVAAALDGTIARIQTLSAVFQADVSRPSVK
jgi:nicotinamide-nucleotide amidase